MMTDEKEKDIVMILLSFFLKKKLRSFNWLFKWKKTKDERLLGSEGAMIKAVSLKFQGLSYI